MQIHFSRLITPVHILFWSGACLGMSDLEKHTYKSTDMDALCVRVHLSYTPNQKSLEGNRHDYSLTMTWLYTSLQMACQSSSAAVFFNGKSPCIPNRNTNTHVSMS